LFVNLWLLVFRLQPPTGKLALLYQPFQAPVAWFRCGQQVVDAAGAVLRPDAADRDLSFVFPVL
jgi:hypothetical protein